MKTITEKEMLEQFQGVNTQRRNDLSEVVTEAHDFMYVDANGLNDDQFLVNYYDVDTVDEMRDAHQRQIEIVEQSANIALILESKLKEEGVGIMNKQQLKEIQNISEILNLGYEELDLVLSQIINKSFVIESDDERAALLRDQHEEAQNLTLAELDIHTFTYNVIKTMRNIIKEMNTDLIESHLRSANKLLRDEAIRMSDLCYTQMGIRMDDYEETKALQRVTMRFNRIDNKLRQDENPFANIDFNADNPFEGHE